MMPTHTLPALPRAHRPALLRAGAALLAATLAAAWPRPAAAADEELPRAVRHCAGSDRLEFAADARVLLEPADRDRVHLAMLKVYPMLQRHGFGASDFVLWHRGGAEWLYVALAHEGLDPGETCYTATFVASSIELTPVLMRKYFDAPRGRHG